MSTPLVDLGALPVSGVAAPGVVLAQDPAPPPGEGPEFGKASPVALVVIILLGLATAFLIRSMTKHLKRVPASFDEPADAAAEKAEPAEGVAAAGDAAEDRKPAGSTNGDRSEPPGPAPA